MKFWKKDKKTYDASEVDKKISDVLKKERELHKKEFLQQEENHKDDISKLKEQYDREKALYEKEVKSLVSFRLTELEAAKQKTKKEFELANNHKLKYHEAEKVLNKYIITARQLHSDSKRLEELIKDIILNYGKWEEFLTLIEQETLKGFRIFDKDLQEKIKKDAKTIKQD